MTLISKKTLLGIATPLSIAIFGFVGLSGFIMFCDIGKNTLMDMHGWLGVMFIVATVLHVWRNWAGFSALLTQGRTLGFLAGFCLIAVGLLVKPQDEEDAAMAGLIDHAEQTTLNNLALIYGVTGDEMVQRLRAGGVTVGSADLTLKQIELSQKQELPALLAIIAKRRD